VLPVRLQDAYFLVWVSPHSLWGLLVVLLVLLPQPQALRRLRVQQDSLLKGAGAEVVCLLRLRLLAETAHLPSPPSHLTRWAEQRVHQA
jgi:hypothetical protein